MRAGRGDRDDGSHAALTPTRHSAAAARPPRGCYVAAHWLLVAFTTIAGCGERPAKVAPEQIARGKQVYDVHCAACHGTKLEGQPNWRERLPNGKLPAPPHDATGHTWHHPDELLFNITKNGIAPYAPPGHESDMPAFGKQLSDEEIRAVLAFIKSTWPEETRKLQAEANASSKR